jgi:hypothetical protein
MNEPAHTTQDGTRQVVVRRIGDVTVTLDMPEGMPVPKVLLHLYSYEPDRIAALHAFDMNDEQHLNEPEGQNIYWYTRKTSNVEATVWFERES